MLSIWQFKELIVTPALTSIDLGGQTAINLVTGTAIQESGLRYLKQVGTGPALGLFQMEPATHDWLWTLPSMKSDELTSLGTRIKVACFWHLKEQPQASDMVWNLYYAAMMCRVRYLASSDPLPAGDAESLAHYWKKIYNSSLGAGVVDRNTVYNFLSAINN